MFEDNTQELFNLRATAKFAYDAHKGQMRRGGEEEYYEHCLRVYQSLLAAGIPCEEASVGLLHDVVEDTEHTLESVKEALPFLKDSVLEALDLVTKREGQSRNEYLTRIVSSGNSLAILCKSYDALDNHRMSPEGRKFTIEVLKRDPDKESQRYLKLSQDLLDLYEVLVNYS